MATVEFTEGKIAAIEGFVVRFHYEGPARAKGPDVRGDRRNVPSYPYQRAASGTMTVATWIERRFRHAYPGFGVVVFDGRDTPVHGKTLLKTVRSSYY